MLFPDPGLSFLQLVYVYIYHMTHKVAPVETSTSLGDQQQFSYSFQEANILSKFAFHWLLPLLKYGYQVEQWEKGTLFMDRRDPPL